jgi:hypothetical protein
MNLVTAKCSKSQSGPGPSTRRRQRSIAQSFRPQPHFMQRLQERHGVAFPYITRCFRRAPENSREARASHASHPDDSKAHEYAPPIGRSPEQNGGGNRHIPRSSTWTRSIMTYQLKAVFLINAEALHSNLMGRRSLVFPRGMDK